MGRIQHLEGFEVQGNLKLKRKKMTSLPQTYLKRERRIVTAHFVKLAFQYDCLGP